MSGFTDVSNKADGLYNRVRGARDTRAVYDVDGR
jgi:hypothetical protein